MEFLVGMFVYIKLSDFAMKYCNPCFEIKQTLPTVHAYVVQSPCEYNGVKYFGNFAIIEDDVKKECVRK